MAGFPSLLETAFGGWSSLDATVKREIAKTRGMLRIAPHPPAPTAPDPDLARIVEAEIIPRLMLAHGRPEPANEDVKGADSELTTVVRLALRPEPGSLLSFVGSLLDQDVSMETIYVELLIPAARRLGVLWEEDEVSFTDVTIGLGRLQQVVHTFGWRSHPESVDATDPPRSALFMPVCGEQHTFGLFIVEDYFRRAGWRTWIEAAPRDEDAADIAHTQWFDVFGLTLSREEQTSAAATCIRAVRKASRNPDLCVLVGGRLLLERPELALQIGADGSASSGGEALLIAGKAVRRLSRSS